MDKKIFFFKCKRSTRFLLYFIFLLLSGRAFAQEPFDIPTSDSSTFTTRSLFTKADTMVTSSTTKNTKFLNNQSLSFLTSESFDFSFPSINSNIVQYRLGTLTKIENRKFLRARSIYTKAELEGKDIYKKIPLRIKKYLEAKQELESRKINDKNLFKSELDKIKENTGISDEKYKYKNQIDNYELDTVRLYIPFILLTKINAKYDSKNQQATLNDATSYFGSPLTLRVMPNTRIPIGLENLITAGFMVDLRALIVGDSLSQKITTDMGIYGSAGLKYSGKGQVRSEDGQNYEGSWSFSALAYYFKGSDKFYKDINALNNKGIGGLEFILKFTVNNQSLSKFNFVAGAIRQFNNPFNNKGWQFRLGIGN